MSEPACAACGRPQWPDANFCAGCGEPHADQTTPEQISLGSEVSPTAEAAESARLRRVLVGLVAILGAIIAVTTLVSGSDDTDDTGTADPNEAAAEATAVPSVVPTVASIATSAPAPSAAPTVGADVDAGTEASAVNSAIIETLLTQNQTIQDEALRYLGELDLGSGWLVSLNSEGDYQLLNLETAELRDPDLLRIKVGQSLERVLSGGLLVETSSGALGSSWVWSPWDESGVLGFDTNMTFTMAVLDDPESGPVIVLQRVEDQTAYAVHLQTGEHKEIEWSAESINSEWVAAGGKIWLPPSLISSWSWDWVSGWTRVALGDVPAAAVDADDEIVVRCDSPTECERGLVRDGDWTAIPAATAGTRMLPSPDRSRFFPLSVQGSDAYVGLAPPADPVVFDAEDGDVIPLVGVGPFNGVSWLTNDALLFTGPFPMVAVLDGSRAHGLPDLQMVSSWWFPDLELE